MGEERTLHFAPVILKVEKKKGGASDHGTFLFLPLKESDWSTVESPLIRQKYIHPFWEICDNSYTGVSIIHTSKEQGPLQKLWETVYVKISLNS